MSDYDLIFHDELIKIQSDLCERDVEFELVADLIQRRTVFTLGCIKCGAEHTAMFKNCVALDKKISDHMLAAIKEFFGSTCTCRERSCPSVEFERVIR